MKKNFVLDTNVLLHDPMALYVFEDNVINIPIYVIEEIDQFKKELSELGRNARQVSRFLDAHRKTGSLRDGVLLNADGTLRVLFLADRKSGEGRSAGAKMDSLILETALDLQQREPDRPVVFITKDTNLRIRADALGLRAEDFDNERIELSELYTGASELSAPPELLDRFYADNTVPLADCERLHAYVDRPAGSSTNGTNGGLPPALEGGTGGAPPLYPNEYLTLVDSSVPKRTALARINAAESRVERIMRFKGGVFGISPRNREQKFALDVLLRDEIKLVTLLGKAGTGKTLLALAAGLQLTLDEKAFLRLLVSRPIYPLGRDIGFLPGGIEDKLNPWMQPIHDNLELLLSLGVTGGMEDRQQMAADSYHELLRAGTVQVEPLTYIRGRSIPNQFMVVDEAQNLTPHEVKTIITRVGGGTKIVFTGDPYQIDNPYVDSVNNGLTYLANRFKSEPIAGSVTLFKGERSALAELAANIL